jgi:hypothetical protein
VKFESDVLKLLLLCILELIPLRIAVKFAIVLVAMIFAVSFESIRV